MSDKRFFLDTNILIYAYSRQELEKREIALRLLTSGEVVTSAQIPNEFCNVMRLKFPERFGF
jgi:predicted nucleic acid-binding protein